VEAAVKGAGRVAVAVDKKFIDSNGKVDEERIFGAISRSLTELLDVEKAAQAWRTLFRPEDRVGIKVNTLSGRRLSTHPGLIRAIVKGLRMAGITEKNILIWDRMTEELDRAGFTIRSSGGVRCFGTDALGYERDLRMVGSIGSCFSRILTDFCTALVNVPVLKDHDLAGVTLGMKNFFGAIHNPNKYHDNSCSPYVADLNSHSLIRDKLRLIVCDGLIALCHGGPAYKGRWVWNYRGLLIGLDPVALDRVGAGIIGKRRHEVGLPSLKDSGREAKYIDVAAQLGLGVSDPKEIILH
jgi:uncharacterized protein (DUF362 family)